MADSADSKSNEQREGELRRSMLEIHNDPHLSPGEKARRMQVSRRPPPAIVIPACP